MGVRGCWLRGAVFQGWEGCAVLHHVEVWVPDLGRAVRSWGWLLEELGWEVYQEWAVGRSWRFERTYIVFEQSPGLTGEKHERCRPGVNHLALWVDGRERVEAIVAEAGAHGWVLMFPERHPYAGGAGHYAAYLEDADGFEVELVSGR
ncbi:VOC family protein [Dactylosporangium sp. NPDC006015]|uniref:VOC family protein n=1 Tax=Dactylosporangium sp. NPDC006015 TaxID=3154576 RepID=UPI0033BE5934